MVDLDSFGLSTDTLQIDLAKIWMYNYCFVVAVFVFVFVLLVRMYSNNMKWVLTSTACGSEHCLMHMMNTNLPSDVMAETGFSMYFPSTYSKLSQDKKDKVSGFQGCSVLQVLFWFHLDWQQLLLKFSSVSTCKQLLCSDCQIYWSQDWNISPWARTPNLGHQYNLR